MLRETLLFPTAKVRKSKSKGELRFPRIRKRFPKKRKQKKRDLRLAINSTQIVVIPPRAFIPRGVYIHPIVESCLLDKLRYPVIIYVFQIFHATNVEHGCHVCNSRRCFDLCAIFICPECNKSEVLPSLFAVQLLRISLQLVWLRM